MGLAYLFVILQDSQGPTAQVFDQTGQPTMSGASNQVIHPWVSQALHCKSSLSHLKLSELPLQDFWELCCIPAPPAELHPAVRMLTPDPCDTLQYV